MMAAVYFHLVFLVALLDGDIRSILDCFVPYIYSAIPLDDLLDLVHSLNQSPWTEIAFYFQLI